MLLRCYNYIEITQLTPVGTTPRTKVLGMDFVNKYEVVSSWDTQTDTATVVIPKNVVIQNADGTTVAMQNINTSIGGGNNPLFMRGDKISIQAGYWYTDDKGVEQQNVKLLFDGYISKVHSKLSITLECEDNMFLLKQVPAPDAIWGGGISIQDILAQCLAGTPFITNGGVIKTQSQNAVTTGIGTFYTRGETVAQVLGRIKRELSINSYIKGNELRIGYPTYYDEDVQNPAAPYQFIFQQNIISDNLQYMRTDDMVLSATAQSYTPGTDPDGTQTKDGQARTRKKKLLVYVATDPATLALKGVELASTDDIPDNEGGERQNYTLPAAQTAQELINFATSELQKTYYTGFRGSFTTFGMPFIPYGDNIILQDKVLPDRDGTYKVKAVTYSGGAGVGIRQEIFLDYKITPQTP